MRPRERHCPLPCRVGQVVLARNCPEVVFKYDLERGDMVEFKINAFSLNINIYKRNSSSAMIYVCPE
jgi:hypothetical protein